MRNQLRVLSVPVDVVSMSDTVKCVQALYDQPGLHLVATANAEMIMLARRDQELRTILEQASLVIPDGAGVLWAAEQKGQSFPERVTGCDLTVELLKDAAARQIPVYLLGAAPGVAERAVRKVEQEVGPLRIVGIHDGFFDEVEEERIIESITQGGAKLVLVALGVPKQEKWIVQRLQHLSGVVAMGVGGTFDVLAGEVKRAPVWMQRNRLEWLYRLYKQPQRFIRMLALPKFMLAVWLDKK